MLRQIKRLFTHEATISGQRQVDEEDDGFGGTQPVYAEVSMTVEGRYESDGRRLTRQFFGEDTDDDPAFIAAGSGLGSWDDTPEGYEPDDSLPWVIREDDTVEFAHLSGTYEIREIEPLMLDSPEPEFVVFNPMEVE